MIKDKKTIKINPWGITGGLFGSVLAVLLLAFAYQNEGVDKFDVIIISAIILAGGCLHSLSISRGVKASKLLYESVLVAQQQSILAIRGSKVISRLSKRAEEQEEFITSLEERVAVQQKYIEALKKQVNV